MAGLAQVERRFPHPVFSELHILKDFKCCVLKLPHSKRVIGGFCGTAHSKEVRLFRSGWNSRVGVNVGFQHRGRRVHGEEVEEWETKPACRCLEVCRVGWRAKHGIW
jgi:hypothetical protein